MLRGTLFFGITLLLPLLLVAFLPLELAWELMANVQSPVFCLFTAQLGFCRVAFGFLWVVRTAFSHAHFFLHICRMFCLKPK